MSLNIDYIIGSLVSKQDFGRGVVQSTLLDLVDKLTEIGFSHE